MDSQHMISLKNALNLSAAGLDVQSDRMRIIAENIANADSIAEPGDEPYRRKTIHFRNVLDKEMGVHKVTVSKIDVDRSDFKKVFDPGNPSADAEGYILKPNVNPLIEKQDMMEAQRAYEANLAAIEVTKQMLARTVELLR